MSEPSLGMFPSDEKAAWLGLRTLVLLRWLAVAGQASALLIAAFVLQITLPLQPCLLIVATSVGVNLVMSLVAPRTARLTGTMAVFMLLFDLFQLMALIALTGGLSNPFAVLVLVPVTIAASALGLRATGVVALASIALVSLVFKVNLPLQAKDGLAIAMPDLFRFGFWLALVIGILFLGLYALRVATEMRLMSRALLATQMALSREQKLTDLGGVVAAAAHELGTPLATIKLVSAEMIDTLDPGSDLVADARLIRDQADRCTRILRSMGRAGKDDLLMRASTLDVVVQEAAEPHVNRGKTVHFDFTPAEGGAARIPLVLRRPEVIHGLRNLIQNAVDFAAANVWVDAEWGADLIMLRIFDDGAGYPTQLIGRIGDPFVRSRRTAARPEYEGMGLGLFIAKTLLERTGAELTFANGAEPAARGAARPERCGAIVEVVWPLSALLAPANMGVGENPVIAP
jgi:two-component system sensor histidine kinase RegB